jgi:hypothetical protein
MMIFWFKTEPEVYVRLVDEIMVQMKDKIIAKE